MSDSVAERVARGITWLDSHELDWRQRINLDRLDIESPHNCVLGQVFLPYTDEFYTDGFDYAHGTFNLPYPTMESLGFDAGDYATCKDLMADYAALKAEWVRILTLSESQDVREARGDECLTQ